MKDMRKSIPVNAFEDGNVSVEPVSKYYNQRNFTFHTFKLPARVAANKRLKYKSNWEKRTLYCHSLTLLNHSCTDGFRSDAIVNY